MKACPQHPFGLSLYSDRPELVEGSPREDFDTSVRTEKTPFGLSLSKPLTPPIILSSSKDKLSANGRSS